MVVWVARVMPSQVSGAETGLDCSCWNLVKFRLITQTIAQNNDPESICTRASGSTRTIKEDHGGVNVTLSPFGVNTLQFVRKFVNNSLFFNKSSHLRYFFFTA